MIYKRFYNAVIVILVIFSIQVSIASDHSMSLASDYNEWLKEYRKFQKSDFDSTAEDLLVLTALQSRIIESSVYLSDSLQYYQNTIAEVLENKKLIEKDLQKNISLAEESQARLNKLYIISSGLLFFALLFLFLQIRSNQKLKKELTHKAELEKRLEKKIYEMQNNFELTLKEIRSNNEKLENRQQEKNKYYQESIADLNKSLEREKDYQKELIERHQKQLDDLKSRYLRDQKEEKEKHKADKLRWSDELSMMTRKWEEESVMTEKLRSEISKLKDEISANEESIRNLIQKRELSEASLTEENKKLVIQVKELQNILQKELQVRKDMMKFIEEFKTIR